MSVAVSLPAVEAAEEHRLRDRRGQQELQQRVDALEAREEVDRRAHRRRVHRRDEHREQRARAATPAAGGACRGSERRARPAAWASAWRAPIRDLAVRRGRRRWSVTRRLRLLVRRRRALEPPAGGVGEHVVEARGVELHVLHRDARLLERAQGTGERRRHRRRCRWRRRRSWRRACAAEPRQHLGGAHLVVGADAHDERVGADRGLEHLRAALAHDPAVVDDGDAAGELVGLLEVLRGEEHGGALGVEPAHLLPQGGAAGGVEAGGGLVEEQHRRLVHERQREVEPAAHAAGVGADPPVGGAGEADALEQHVAAPVGLRLGDAVQHGLEPHQLAARSSAGRWRRPAAPRRWRAARRRPPRPRRSRPPAPGRRWA